MTWPIVEITTVAEDGERYTYTGKGNVSFVETQIPVDGEARPAFWPKVTYVSANLVIEDGPT